MRGGAAQTFRCSVAGSTPGRIRRCGGLLKLDHLGHGRGRLAAEPALKNAVQPLAEGQPALSPIAFSTG